MRQQERKMFYNIKTSRVDLHYGAKTLSVETTSLIGKTFLNLLLFSTLSIGPSHIQKYKTKRNYLLRTNSLPKFADASATKKNVL
jgi:hypothetical protein